MLDQSLQDFGGRQPRAEYPPEAFQFVQDGLQHTIRRIHGEEPEDMLLDESRHVSGRDLCEGLRDFAVKQFGGLALLVLGKWNIRSTEDFGRIVFAMVDAGLLRKTDEDSIEDFRGVYDFREAFGASSASVN